MPSSAIMAVAVAALAGFFSSPEVQAFLPPTLVSISRNIAASNSKNHHATASSTALSMGKRKKPSMKERRKQRAKRQPGFKVDRGILEDLPPVDAWEKTQPQPTAVVATAPESATEDSKVDETEDSKDDETEETFAKASSLVQSQRKSIECLTYIRERVEESFPITDAVKAIGEQGYFVHDGFLSSDELLSEMFEETSNMLSNDKLERDLGRLPDGEFIAKISGGEAYIDCPRLTEYVVSLTRHLPPLVNNEIDALKMEDVSKLDSAASMGTLRVYDRKTRLGAETLLMKPDDEADIDQDRPFGVICGDSEGTEGDARRLTALLYLSSEEWDASVCGGGVTVEQQGKRVDAIRDRIILIRSDTCSHRQEPWMGQDEAGLEQASCVVVHFVKEAANSTA